MNYEERPWGTFNVLQTEANFQVKKIVVNPRMRLSLQSHKYRAEHWFVVSGSGLVQLNYESKEVAKGESVDVPIGAKHRITCTSIDPLVFVEVQTGSCFNENDITRHEDDFGRN